MPKVCKQGRDDIIVKVIYKAQSLHLFTLQLQTGGKMMQGWGFVYLPSLLYHPYLVCILFGMPSLHLLMFFKSCTIYISITIVQNYRENIMCLYCYKCATRVTMPTATNEWYFFRYSGDNDFIIRTFDFIAHSDAAHVTCSTWYRFSRDLQYWYRFSRDL